MKRSRIKPIICAKICRELFPAFLCTQLVIRVMKRFRHVRVEIKQGNHYFLSNEKVACKFKLTEYKMDNFMFLILISEEYIPNYPSREITP